MKRTAFKSFCLVLALVAALASFASCKVEQPSKPNPAFDKLLADNGIDYTCPTGNYTAFALKTDDSFQILEIKYNEKDIVLSINQFQYYDTKDVEKETVDKFIAEVEKNLKDYEKVPGTTCAVKQNGDTLVINVSSTDLNNKDTLKKAVDAGIVSLSGDKADFVSVTQSRQGLTENGFIEKYTN